MYGRPPAGCRLQAAGWSGRLVANNRIGRDASRLEVGGRRAEERAGVLTLVRLLRCEVDPIGKADGSLRYIAMLLGCGMCCLGAS